MAKEKILTVQGRPISFVTFGEEDFISLTDMLKAKDGDFFVSDWLRNRNTVEFLSIWESVYNPDFIVSFRQCTSCEGVLAVQGLRP